LPFQHDLTAILHELRGFDPAWFENAHSITMYLLASRRLVDNPSCFCQP
jgi:hypothetical protein